MSVLYLTCHTAPLNFTSRFDFDFYLQAHAGLQGTVRPTHYSVILDETQSLTADEVQQGTHHLSYLYGRATKAVSLIPAAYYADLACERGRCYINEFLSDDKASSSGRSGKTNKDDVFEAARVMWGEGVSAYSTTVPASSDQCFFIR